MLRYLVIAACWMALMALSIGILLGLLARVRDAAFQHQCCNNLKGIGIAVLNYYDVNGSFPKATYPNRDLPPERRLSWLFELDPYVHARMDPTWLHHSHEAWDSPGNIKLQRGRMPWYECAQATKSSRVDGLGFTSYVGICGVDHDAADLPKTDKRAGVFGHERKVVFADISDGLSFTTSVIETGLDIGPWVAGGSPTIRFLNAADLPYIGRERQFGGNHRDVMPILLADGSARLVRASISAETLRALFTIAAGDEIGNIE